MPLFKIDNRGLPVSWTHKLFIRNLPLSWYWSSESLFLWIPAAITVVWLTVVLAIAYVAWHFIKRYW